MNDGLIGGFDRAFAGLTEADVERYEAEQRLVERDALDGRAPAVASDRATAPDGDSVIAGSVPTIEHAHTPEPPLRRPVEPHAESIAQRLTADILASPGRTASSSEAAIVHVTIVTAAERRPVPPGSSLSWELGRGAGDDDPSMMLVDRGVASRRHCRIDAGPAGLSVTDLGSSNGTVVVRDREIIEVHAEPVALQVGDILATAGGAATLATVEGTS